MIAPGNFTNFQNAHTEPQSTNVKLRRNYCNCVAVIKLQRQRQTQGIKLTTWNHRHSYLLPMYNVLNRKLPKTIEKLAEYNALRHCAATPRYHRHNILDLFAAHRIKLKGKICNTTAAESKFFLIKKLFITKEEITVDFVTRTVEQGPIQ